MRNLTSALLPLLSLTVGAQERQPEIHGTLRAKYELQTEKTEQRFEVRTARLSVTGNVTQTVSYKAEIDLCDEGKIKMLDAYSKFKMGRELNFTIGQMRVPFTIDAHRSPHQQYFANRSFIAKQVGNVRDVGASLTFVHKALSLQAGLFNGSGLTDQKDYWTKSVNFSAKVQVALMKGFNWQASIQKIKPNDINVMMYDVGLFYHRKGLHIEGEYLYKHYANNMFDKVRAMQIFVSCNIKTNEKAFIKSVETLARFDFMTDHSDGSLSGDGKAMKLTDYQRGRLTAGVTLHLDRPFIADIRVNCEKYFYRRGALTKPSENDKLVVEFMTRF